MIVLAVFMSALPVSLDKEGARIWCQFSGKTKKLGNVVAKGVGSNN